MMHETSLIKGHFGMTCHERLGGKLLWREEFDNVVCTNGKNVALDAFLAGSSYTVVGPFLGLISSISFTATAAADTMASHAGWLEAGAGSNFPLISTPASGARATCAWSAAASGAKALSAGLAFTTGATGGTIQGAFVVYGTSAVATNGNTSGTLLSAGAFPTPQPVVTGNVVTVFYSLSL